MLSPVSVCLQCSGKLQLLSLWCCLLIKAGNELSHIHLCRSPHEREKERERGLETTEQKKGTLCVHEGERGCLNYVTCLLFHSTAAPLGYSLFTLLHHPWRSVCSRKRMMGWDESGYSKKGKWKLEGQRQNEVGERNARKGLKTSRSLEEERSVKGEGKGVEEWGIEGVCLPRSEQAVLSSSSSLCPRWLCLWLGPAVAIIRHK